MWYCNLDRQSLKYSRHWCTLWQKHTFTLTSELIAPCKNNSGLWSKSKFSLRFFEIQRRFWVFITSHLLRSRRRRGIEWSRRDFARLRDEAYFSKPETLFHRFPFFSKFETLRRLFAEKRDFETREIWPKFFETDFLRGPFDTPRRALQVLAQVWEARSLCSCTKVLAIVLLSFYELFLHKKNNIQDNLCSYTKTLPFEHNPRSWKAVSMLSRWYTIFVNNYTD